ncbi:DUF2304 domain-containing protein [Mycetocola spongiae]|uniref:DUF2304 domain-containing protein n=1 Tax=Mycetocola spongiae TaxID=2859226 RepID=UPI001CF506E4|nr:DUF2304 domain-containing protein [Mycetocola spongiae]UCR90336.1 DUF2304 domain-containing protein [Mycetocola spongiae]
MTWLPHLLAIFAALLILVLVIEMLRRRRLKERHATWWLLAGTIALVASLAPSTLEWFSGVLGITIPLNLVFFACAAVLFLVCLQHSSELSTLEENVRVLTEESALHQMRLVALESALGEQSPRADIELPSERETPGAED